MSFKPKRKASSNSNPDAFKYPAPASDGLQFARVSLIVDMGTQAQENGVYVYNPNDAKHVEALKDGTGVIEIPEYGNDKGKECISLPRKPKESVAVFVDLVEETVDYGTELGQRHYRLMLNKNFKNDIAPIPFGAVKPTKDGDKWTFAPASLLTKLAIATNTPEVIGKGTEEQNMDLGLLLGKPLQINIEVKTTEKGDKKYTNVYNKGLSPLRKTDVAPELVTPALLITFDNATADSVKFIRRDLREKIKQATDFAGSNMEAAFKAAGFMDGNTSAPAQAPQRPEVDAPAVSDFDSDSPF